MVTKAYSYIRMSSEKQIKGDSLQRQLSKTKEYADEQGWVLDTTLRDMGVSAYKGKNVEDGALGKFIELCRDGDIERGSILIIENLDRMSRQRPLDAFNIFTNILKLGIEIVVLDDRKHYTEDSMEIGDFFMSIGGMERAHKESERKSELIGSAWAKKRKNAANEIMTKTCPAWMVLADDRSHFKIIEKNAETVRLIYELCIAGYGYNAICKKLTDDKVPTFTGGNGWHQAYIKVILRGKTAIGMYQPHSRLFGARGPEGDLVPDYYPRVIDDVTYFKAQDCIDNRINKGRGRKGKKHSSLFTGLLKCGTCGKSTTYSNRMQGKRTKAARYVRCYNASRGQCTNKKYHNYDYIEKQVFNHLDDLCIDDLTKTKKQENTKNSEKLDKAKASLRISTERRKELVIQFLDTKDETYKELSDQFKAEQQDAKKTIALLSDEISKSSIPVTKARQIVDNIESYNCMTKGVDDKTLFDIRIMISAEMKKIVSHIGIYEDGFIVLHKLDSDFSKIILPDLAQDILDNIELQIYDEDEIVFEDIQGSMTDVEMEEILKD